jgi:dTDP-4-dehydrorhamnose reductase
MRTILVTGGTGQVGHALAALDWPADITLHLPPRGELDIASEASIRAAFAARDYAAVINPAAHTAVDRAEEEAVAAFAANAHGPAVLAELCAAADIPLVHVSTDYVFDGAGSDFRDEDDPVRPLGVYGASKLAGELAVAAVAPRHVTLRTAWVLSAHGVNFLKTMLRLGAERDTLGIVADQYGCPTSAYDIAEALSTIVLRMLDDPAAPRGTYHFVNAGDASWHDLATEIFALAGARGQHVPTTVTPLPSSAYPTRATRPANSRLSTTRIADAFGIVPRPWQAAVADILDRLAPPPSIPIA